jgi:hypothetical protein
VPCLQRCEGMRLLLPIRMMSKRTFRERRRQRVHRQQIPQSGVVIAVIEVRVGGSTGGGGEE